MKKNITRFLCICSFLFFWAQANAQLNYLPGGFTTTAGTYTDLGTTGTLISVANTDDAFSAPLPIGFTFNFNGAPYDTFIFSTNGFIKLGKDTPSRHFLFTTQAQPPANGPFTSTTSPTPLGKDSSMLFAFGQDLYAGTMNSEFRYTVTGSTGSQVCTIQWKNVRDKLQGGVGTLWDTINFQIKLYETTNVVEYVYGKFTSTVSLSAARFSAVGIVGNNMVTANQNLHLVKGSTVVWSGAVANTGFYLNNAVNYRNPTSSPAGPAPEIGRTYTFTPLTMNDASVRAIYAQGRVAKPFYLPDSIRANIVNTGVNFLTNVWVKLTISGANSYIDSTIIFSLAPNANANVAFTPYYPNNLGASLITVSVPLDDNNANNTKTYSFSVSNTRNGYTDTLVLASGSNGTTIPNFWGAKYFVAGSGMVTTVRAPLVSNSEALNDTVCGLVMDSMGVILARSPNYIVQASDLGTTLVFNMVVPAVVSNQSVIVGIAGGQTVTGLTYFLGTSQTEVPVRPNTTFYFMSQSAIGGVTNVNVGAIYATPVAWSTTRLMMECNVEPLPPVDVGVSASGPHAAVKIPANFNIPLRAVVKNRGTQTRPSGIQVRYRVNGGAIIGPVSTTSSILPGDTTSVLFSGAMALNVGAAGTYEVKIYTSLAGDAITGNDTLTINYTAVPMTNLPYRIANNILGSWTTIGNTPALWKQKSCIQPNGVVNASVLFADNIITTPREALLLSPPMSLSGSAHPVLHFNVAHAPNTFSNTDDTLQVLVSTNGGLSYTALYTRSSMLSSPTLGTDTPTSSAYTPAYMQDWRHESVDLGAFAGSPYILLAFRDRSASGNGVYIANVSVTNAVSHSVQGVSSPGSFFSGNMSVLFSTIGNTSGEIAFTRYNNAPYSSASPVFASNTTATSNNSSIFTPSNTSITHWYSITYSGSGTGNYPNSILYSLNFDLTGVSGIQSMDSLYLLRRTDFNGSWVPVSTYVSGNNLYTALISGFSDFTIGSVSAVNTLPVEWLSFTGKKLESGYGLLNWSTASESNNSHFEVERSTDSEHYVFLAKVQATGNSHSTQKYSFTDKTLNNSGPVHYRIKQVDKDAQFSYSNVVTLRDETETGKSEISISNPFDQVPTVWVNQTSAGTEIQLHAFDMSGKLLFTKTLEINGGRTAIQLEEMKALKQGMYFIKCFSQGTETETFKLLKLQD